MVTILDEQTRFPNVSAILYYYIPIILYTLISVFSDSTLRVENGRRFDIFRLSRKSRTVDLTVVDGVPARAVDLYSTLSIVVRAVRVYTTEARAARIPPGGSTATVAGRLRNASNSDDI